MDAVFSKLVCAIVIWATAFLGAVLAFKFQEHDHLQRLGTLFGGGVFLGAGLIHLLADAVKSLDEIYDYPVAMVVCSVGLLTTMFVDSIVKVFLVQTNATNGAAAAAYSPLDSAQIEESIDHDSVHHNDGWEVQHEPGHVRHAPSTESTTIRGVAVGIVLWLALSFHSFVAGFALGTSTDIWAVFAAIIAHKAVASYALGTNLLQADISRRRYLLSMGVFSFVTPCGIFLGTLAASTLDEHATGFFIAFAAGTFLYVAVVEVLGHELESGAHSHDIVSPALYHVSQSTKNPAMADIFAFVFGWIVMAVLAIWV